MNENYIAELMARMADPRNENRRNGDAEPNGWPLALATNGPRIFSTVPWPFIEAYAYSFLYAEKYAEAVPLIDVLCAKIQSVPDLSESSQQWLERSQRIQTLLQTAPHEAKLLLEQWERRTISNLKLDKYTAA